MKKYTLYFEFFGRKMKFSCVARSESEAKLIVIDKIQFHKITETSDNDLEELFKKFFGI